LGRGAVCSTTFSLGESDVAVMCCLPQYLPQQTRGFTLDCSTHTIYCDSRNVQLYMQTRNLQLLASMTIITCDVTKQSAEYLRMQHECNVMSELLRALFKPSVCCNQLFPLQCFYTSKASLSFEQCVGVTWLLLLVCCKSRLNWVYTGVY